MMQPNARKEIMYKVTLLYGRPDDPEEFERYYTTTHAAVSDGVAIRAVRAEKWKVLPVGPEGPAPYYRISELWFDTREDLEITMTSQAMRRSLEDLHSFATGGTVILTSESI